MAERNPKRIFVVDDAALVRRYYRATLEAAGFAVDEAMNGIEALEKLLDADTDLLIVDVNMPQMDGFTFLATLRRQDAAAASIPAIVISTESKPADLAAARAAGANLYLVKPVAGDDLIACAKLMTGLPA